MVIVQVGETKKNFPVHKGLISHHSNYFDAQFSGRWGNESTVPFTEADETTFQAFYQYIYTLRLVPNPNRTVRKGEQAKSLTTLPNASDTAATAETEIKSSPYTFSELCRMYVLGDFLISPGFQAAAMDAICELLAAEWFDPWPDIDYVYENTKCGCGLRRFFADWFSKTSGSEGYWPEAFKSHGPEVHHQFLVDVVVVLQGIVHDDWDRKPQTKREWKDVNKCLYHDHEDAKEAEKEGGSGDEP